MLMFATRLSGTSHTASAEDEPEDKDLEEEEDDEGAEEVGDTAAAAAGCATTGRMKRPDRVASGWNSPQRIAPMTLSSSRSGNAMASRE